MKNSFQLLLIIGFFAFLIWSYFNLSTSDVDKIGAGTATVYRQDEKQLAFENIILEAKAAYVFDISKNQPLFEFNSESQLPLASIAKIMTAVVAAENLPSYLDITITEEAILAEGDDGFLAGERWSVFDLLDVMLVASSNDAASSLAFEFNKDFGGDFVSLMNQKTKELGLTQTYFLNSAGLDLSKNTSGAYGSAKDIAKLLVYAAKNHSSLLESTRLASINLRGREFKNTNQIVNDLTGFMAGKTGFSDLAGGNLAVMVDKAYGHPFIIVVLGSTFEGRFTDVKTLYNLIP